MCQMAASVTSGYYARIDVSLEQSSGCIVNGNGKIFREGKVPQTSSPLEPFTRLNTNPSGAKGIT
jgi:hypothetical protein